MATPTLNADPIALSPVRGNILTRKLIIVAFDSPSQQQMASVRVVKLAQHLLHFGWDITILTNQPGLRDFFQMEQMDSVDVVSFKNSDSFNPIFWPLQNFEKTDGILTIGSKSHFLGALIKLKNPKASWLMDEGSLSSNPEQNSQPRNGLLDRFFFRQATCVSVLDESARKQYTQPLTPKLKNRFVTLRNDYTPGGTEATDHNDDSIDQEIAVKVHRILCRKARRPKIFHQHGRQKTLVPDKGDKINQISFMLALSRFADVYYNGQLFTPDAADFGLKEKKPKPPKGHYDLYIVRNNAAIFNQCPQPKLWIGSMYDKQAFEDAQAVLTLTSSWKERLEKYYTPGLDTKEAARTLFNNFLPPDMVKPRQIINIKQVISPHFFDAPNEERIAHYKESLGKGFTVAYMGQMNILSYPYNFMRCLPKLKELIADLNVAFVGPIQDLSVKFAEKSGYVPPEHESIDFSKVSRPPDIPFTEMPSAIRACKVLLANEQPEANWAGSVKPLEAMVCGVPFLTTRRPVRVEQFGDEYPLYYETDQELIDHMVRLANDAEFYQDVRSYLLARAQLFTIDKMSEYLEDQLKSFL